MLAFERSEDLTTMFQDELKHLDPTSQRFISHRQQINLIKKEKAKNKNFDDQHRWKLKGYNGTLKKGLKAHLNKEKLMLHRSYLTDSMERVRVRQQQYATNLLAFKGMNNSVQGHVFADRTQDRKFYPTARINFKDRLALGIQDPSNRFPNL